MVKRKNTSDFQKVKLKVGRKLRKENETNTDFKVKKIILKETTKSDAIKTLIAVNSPTTTQLKLASLRKLSDGYLSANPNEITGEVINALSKLLLDSDYRVRSEAIKCSKQCLQSLEKRQQCLTPFVEIMLTYIRCGLTHIDVSVCKDSRKMFLFVVEKADKSLHNQLMEVTLSRLNCSSPVVSDYELFALVVGTVFAHSDEDTFKPFEIKWSPDNCFIDIHSLRPKEPTFAFNITFQELSKSDTKSTFTSSIMKFVDKEIKCLLNRKTWSFNEDDAKKAIAVLEMNKTLKKLYPTDYKPRNGLKSIPDLSVVLDDDQKQKRKKQEAAISNLKRKLSQLMSLLL